MTLRLLAEVSPQELLEGLADLQSHMLGYVKSMALKGAVDLGIPEAIHRRGGAATLTDIVADTGVHPAKVADLRRLMDLLSASGMFTLTSGEGSGGGGSDAAVYRLTTACRFLVGYLNLSPIVPFFVNPLVVSSFFSLGDWFRSEPAAAGSLFELTHGSSQWEMARKDAALGSILKDSMVADNKLFLEVIILDKGRIFRGLSSLVDVGGGNGTAAQVIARAFPRMKCIVLDLPHVVEQAAAGDDNMQFVAGDMFESIPPANAVFLKVSISLRSL
jgi:acetylserotonin O-methyltransferase, plant